MKRSYYHTNAIYSVMAISNSTGELTEVYHYDAYGRTAVATAKGPDGNFFTPDDPIALISAAGNPYAFTGQRLDPSGLMYYKNRYYHTELWRFCSRDLDQSFASRFNLFNYSNFNPSRMKDRVGLSPNDGWVDFPWGKRWPLFRLPESCYEGINNCTARQIENELDQATEEAIANCGKNYFACSDSAHIACSGINIDKTCIQWTKYEFTSPVHKVCIVTPRHKPIRDCGIVIDCWWGSAWWIEGMLEYKNRPGFPYK